MLEVKWRCYLPNRLRLYYAPYNRYTWYRLYFILGPGSLIAILRNFTSGDTFHSTHSQQRCTATPVTDRRIPSAEVKCLCHSPRSSYQYNNFRFILQVSRYKQESVLNLYVHPIHGVTTVLKDRSEWHVEVVTLDTRRLTAASTT